MRVEDLEGPRAKPRTARQMLEELAWLGFRWEQPVVRQSQRAEHYRNALERLITAGAAYPCVCSRKDIRIAAHAPHADEAAGAYPGTCRGRFASAREAARAANRPFAWRVRTDGKPLVVHDRFAGEHTFRLAETCGDFVIFREGAGAAYQLAVVVDDCASGVDAIVRGDDLLESAARQAHLRGLLGLGPEPAYWHLPLVVGPDGRRLAKRHGDTRLSHYRGHGATPERVLGLLGYSCGLLPRRREADLDELAGLFDLSRIPREPYVFTAEDDAFLRVA